MNKHRAIPSSEMARTLSFVYDRFDGNSNADILGKARQIGYEEASQPERTFTIITAPLSALDSIFRWLDPIAVASIFGQLSLVRPLL